MPTLCVLLSMNGFRILIIVLVTVYSTGGSFAQDALYLESFNGEVRGQSILLEWVTEKGFTCEDLVVEYSTDTLNWQEVHKIPGICGSESERQQYAFIFREPQKGKKNYFRLDLGVFGYSALLEVRAIPDKLSDIRIFPNPATMKSMVQFHNSGREEVTVQLFYADGQMLAERSMGRISEFRLNEILRPEPGIYLLVIRRGSLEPKVTRLVIR